MDLDDVLAVMAAEQSRSTTAEPCLADVATVRRRGRNR